MSRKTTGQARPRVKQPLPDDYVCIAPSESLLVFDYLKGKVVDKRLVALHVNLCYRCQETVKSMKDIDEVLKELLVEVI